MSSIIGFVQKVGVFLFSDRAVDGEVAQLIVTVVDIDLAQSLLLRAGREGRRGQDTEYGY